jgi:hypothetical protein
MNVQNLADAALLERIISHLTLARLQILQFCEQTRVDQARQTMVFSAGNCTDALTAAHRALALRKAWLQ